LSNRGSSIDHFIIGVDTNISSDAYMHYNYLVILGHDIHSANTKFKITRTDTLGSGYNSPAMTSKVNATESGWGGGVPLEKLVEFNRVDSNYRE